MPRRALRRFSLFVLIGILMSLVPAHVQGARMAPRDIPVRMPTISDDGELPIPRPAAAQPSYLPASYATTAATQVEGSHQSGFFDGTFSGKTRQVMFSDNGTYTHSTTPGNAIFTMPFIVPANQHDSVDFDVQVQGGGDRVDLLMRTKPVTATWDDDVYPFYIILWSNSNGPTPVTRQHVILNHTRVPANVDIDVQFFLWGLWRSRLYRLQFRVFRRDAGLAAPPRVDNCERQPGGHL